MREDSITNKKTIARLLNLKPFIKKFENITKVPELEEEKAKGENTTASVVLEVSMNVSIPIRNLFFSRIICFLI